MYVCLNLAVHYIFMSHADGFLPRSLPSYCPLHPPGSDLQHSVGRISSQPASGFCLLFLMRLSSLSPPETAVKESPEQGSTGHATGGGGEGGVILESIKWLSNLKQRCWVLRRLLHVWLFTEWMPAQYILTVLSTYKSSTPVLGLYTCRNVSNAQIKIETIRNYSITQSLHAFVNICTMVGKKPTVPLHKLLSFIQDLVKSRGISTKLGTKIFPNKSLKSTFSLGSYSNKDSFYAKDLKY